VTYEEWELSVPRCFQEDSLWRVRAYRLALFLGDLVWHDAEKLAAKRWTQGMAGQLLDAVTSMSSNIAEGYSRNTGRERARFYEFALGSARESRGWYSKSRRAFGDRVANHRMEVTTEILRLVSTMVPDQRRKNRALSMPRLTTKAALT
jgi:four helix bundle protein